MFGTNAFGQPYFGQAYAGITSVLNTRTLTDTGVTSSDSLTNRCNRTISDTGLTQTDSVTSTRRYFKTSSDTGVTQSDSIIVTRRLSRTISDTGVTPSDSLIKRTTRVVTDTGTSFTESLVLRSLRVITDTGVTNTDSLVRVARRGLTATDTGTSFSDTLALLRLRKLTDTGTTQTDTLSTRRSRPLADTGLTQSDSLTRVARFSFTAIDTGVQSTVTNLVTNGGFETDTISWGTQTPNTLVRSTAQARFGAGSGLGTRDTGTADSNCGYFSLTLIAQLHTASAYVWVPTAYDGTSVDFKQEGFTSATGTQTVSANLSIRDAWQQVQFTVTPDPSDLTGAFVFRLVGATTGKFIYIDGVQVETGAVAHNYVETNGASATGSNSDTLTPLRLRKLTDTGTTPSDSLLTRRSLVLSDTLSFSDTLAERIAHNLSDTLTLSDSLVRVLTIPRTITDTGVTSTDTLDDRRIRVLADTLTFSDSIFKSSRTNIIDTGLTQTDSLDDRRLRVLSDVGLSLTDSISRIGFYQRSIVETGLTLSENVVKIVATRLTDTGFSFSDVTDIFKSQISRPTSDITTGTWTVTPLYPKINEPAPGTDAAFISSALQPVSADIAEIGMAPLNTPPRTDGHVVRYRISRSVNPGAPLQLTVRLMQGTTQISSWVVSNVPNIATTYENYLTTAEASSITNYANLRIKLEALSL